MDWGWHLVAEWLYQRKHQRSAALAFVREIHLWPMENLPVDDVIMYMHFLS